MIKLRSAWLCNIKLFLIFLTVAGHCMEQAGLAGTLLYKLIYLFHMPGFAFVSGMGLRTEKKCMKSAGSAAILYCMAQGILVLYGAMTGRRISFFTPYWHLWYLLSLVCWSLLVWCCHCLEKTVSAAGSMWLFCFAVSALSALLCGFFPLGRFLSLSRTVVFFPYVLLGVFFSGQFPSGLSRSRKKWLSIAGIAGFPVVCTVLKRSGYVWLYRADSYRDLHLQPAEGMLLRILCFFAAADMILVIMVCIPSKKILVTQIGSDTLPIYLLHAIPVGCGLLFPQKGSAAAAMLNAVLITVAIRVLSKWFRPLYGVTN